jgi:uncharacterized protein YuzB (UPF0349 family)
MLRLAAFLLALGCAGAPNIVNGRFVEEEPNDTVATANGPFVDDVVIEGAVDILSGDQVDFFEVVSVQQQTLVVRTCFGFTHDCAEQTFQLADGDVVVLSRTPLFPSRPTPYTMTLRFTP